MQQQHSAVWEHYSPKPALMLLPEYFDIQQIYTLSVQKLFSAFGDTPRLSNISQPTQKKVIGSQIWQLGRPNHSVFRTLSIIQGNGTFIRMFVEKMRSSGVRNGRGGTVTWKFSTPQMRQLSLLTMPSKEKVSYIGEPNVCHIESARIQLLQNSVNDNSRCTHDINTIRLAVLNSI